MELGRGGGGGDLPSFRTVLGSSKKSGSATAAMFTNM